MDWILSVTTLFVNSGLGWFKGAWWMWGLHALNAALWIGYALCTNQYGFILLSVSTIIMDGIFGYRSFKDKE